MLVIRRRVGDSILIGPEVEIRVLEVLASRVVLGITAPQSVPVLRKEVLATAEQNRQSTLPVSQAQLATLVSTLRPSPHR